MDFIANLIYVLILSIISIAIGIILRHFWSRIKDKTVKWPWIKKRVGGGIKKPTNTFQFVYFCVGIVLALFEIAKFSVWGWQGNTDIAAYIPIYLSSYFMYLFITNGFTRRGSFCNIAISNGTYITAIMLWTFMFVSNAVLHNSVAIILWHHDQLDFAVWHTIIYHTIALIFGIIFLIVNPCKVDAWKGCLKGLIPLVALLTVAYFCSTFPPHETVDVLGNPDFNVVTREIFKGVGQIVALYNLVVFIIETILYIVCYYLYYTVSVLIPKLVKYLSSKKKHSSLHK